MKYVQSRDGRARATLWVKFRATPEEYKHLSKMAKHFSFDSIHDMLSAALDTGMIYRFEQYDDDTSDKNDGYENIHDFGGSRSRGEDE